MPKSILTALRTASLVVVVSGFLALATTEEFDTVLVLIPLILGAIMPICEQLDAQFTGYRKMTTVINLLVFPVVFVAPIFLGLLNSVIMLVIYIQVYVVLHRKRERDYYYMYLMSFFLLVASCVLAPEPTIGFVMLLFLISSIWAFLILQIYVEMERNQNATTPDLLSLHEHDHQVIAPAERWLDAGVVVPVSGLCVVAILLTTALFVFTPRMEAGFFGRNDPARFETGLNNEVAISTSGEIEPDRRILLRVEFPEEADKRYPGEFFWRAASYNTYAGGRWTQRRLSTDYIDAVPDPAYRVPVEEGSETRTLLREPSRNSKIVHQVIYLDELVGEGLPCLSTVVRLDFAASMKDARVTWSDDNDATVRVRYSRQGSVTYDAWSEVEDDVPADVLRQCPDNYETAMGPRDYDRLTDYQLTPAAEELARELTAGEDTVYDKVRALESWFHSPEFLYSFVIPTLDSQRPIDDFILNARVGHCELFATAMALMLRSIGIPCRVVSGYRGADWVDSEGAYIVSADMAHLWVEVYFIDQGWFSFDPSPPIDREITGFDRFWRQASLLTMRTKMFWLSQVVGFRGLQWGDLRSFASGFLRSGIPDPQSSRGSGLGIALPTFVLFTMLALIAVIFYVRSVVRGPGDSTRRMSLDQLRAQRLFRVMRVKLRHAGLNADGKTAEELVEACAAYPPEPRESLVEALEVYNAARFGGRPLSSEQYARLRKGLRVLARKLRAS